MVSRTHAPASRALPTRTSVGQAGASERDSQTNAVETNEAQGQVQGNQAPSPLVGEALGEQTDPYFSVSSMEEPTVGLATAQSVAPSRVQSANLPGANAQLNLVDWTEHNATFDDEGPYVAAGPIHVPSTILMKTPFGEALSPWMKGTVVGKNIKRPRRREDEASARAYLPTVVSMSTLTRLNQMNIYAGDASVALRDGLSEADLVDLLDAGAGHHAIAFLNEAKDTSVYRSVTVTLKRLLDRWGPHTELVTERFVALARSDRVKNPEELKSWYMGAGTKDIAADGYATMLNDAVDLIEAGHDIALEEMPPGHPPGLGDIIDLTEKIVYQHKRAAGKGLGANIKKAVKQLKGFNDTPGAPAGFFGVAQIDARHNKHFVDKPDAFFEDMVAALQLAKSDSLGEIQIVLDDRMLVFGADQSLDRVVRSKAEAE